MPVPLRIFECYATYFRNPSNIIKVDLVRMVFIGKASMAVDWNSHIFVGCIRHGGSICYLKARHLVLSIFLPSRYSHRILGAAGGTSQTSKI